MYHKYRRNILLKSWVKEKKNISSLTDTTYSYNDHIHHPLISFIVLTNTSIDFSSWSVLLSSRPLCHQSLFLDPAEVILLSALCETFASLR